jgi:hypothetical protein
MGLPPKPCHLFQVSQKSASSYYHNSMGRVNREKHEQADRYKGISSTTRAQEFGTSGRISNSYSKGSLLETWPR